MTQRTRHPSAKGRGALSNESSRYDTIKIQDIDDGWEQSDKEHAQRTQISSLNQRTLITYNTSPDLSFDRTINPYKGCEHGCIYCYARPNHAYLGLSPGLDFERRIFAKPNAAQLLRAQLARPTYRPAPIILGADTDPYQPAERRLRITRDILNVLAEARHPVGIVSKSDLVLRDIDVLADMAADQLVKVALSVTTQDRKLARAMEPRAATPARRLAAMEMLATHGVPVRVMTAPVIPGLTDHELEGLLAAAAEAGTSEAGYVLLRLPLEIKDLFQEWLKVERPDAAKRVISLMRQSRDGSLYKAEWGERQRGKGAYADLIAARFHAATRRLGLNRAAAALRSDLFIRPSVDGQGDLFANTPNGVV